MLEVSHQSVTSAGAWGPGAADMIYFAADCVGFSAKRPCRSRSGLQRLPKMEKDEKRKEKQKQRPKVSHEACASFKGDVNGGTDGASEGNYFSLHVGQEILGRRQKWCDIKERRV